MFKIIAVRLNTKFSLLLEILDYTRTHFSTDISGLPIIAFGFTFAHVLEFWEFITIISIKVGFIQKPNIIDPVWILVHSKGIGHLPSLGFVLFINLRRFLIFERLKIQIKI